MKPQRLTVMLAVAWMAIPSMWTMAALAAEPPPAKPAQSSDKSPAPAKEATPAAAEPSGKPKADERAGPVDEDTDPEPKKAASAADKAASPQRFTPSEQVRADFDVSFPIDI